MGGHEEANRHFLRLCEQAYKMQN